MMRLSLAALLGALVAGVAAWSAGGRVANGIVAGYALGAALAGLGAMHVLHTLRTRPDKAFQAFAVSFLFKLAALVGGGFAFRYLPSAAERADWRGFLVAFAAAVVLVLPFGVWDAVRFARRPSRGVDAGPLEERGSVTP